MIEENLKVEVITPTIMGGANSRFLDSIKIRPSEIKSMMRYAFRTVAGKYINHEKEIEKLLEAEGKIFGDTSQKSDFKILIENTENLRTSRIKLLPHKNNFSKEAVLPGQLFEIKIISNKYSLDLYKSLLNLAFLFGVGNRRNRLMGNLQINNNLKISEDVKTISKKCQKLFEKTEEIKTDNPTFPSFTFREENNQKNYLVYSIPLKLENNSLNIENFEKILTSLYKDIIHKIEENCKYSKILGSANPRQSSFINFSIQKSSENSYKVFLIGFYYENECFGYNIWKEAIEETKNLTQQTFQGG